MKNPVLSKPPIIEAIIDFQVEGNKNYSINELEVFFDFLPEKQYTKKKKMTIKSGFQTGKNGNVEIVPIETTPIGFRFDNKKENKIIQIESKRLIFNKLKPYEKWEKYIKDFKSKWELFCEMFKSDRIKKIAVRYINEIKIPLPMNDFKDYIKMIPDIPNNLPQSISNLILRLDMPNKTIGANAIILERIKKVVPNEYLIFDFSISIDKNVSLTIESSKVWDYLEDLRNFKNKIFFENLTEKTLELYK